MRVNRKGIGNRIDSGRGLGECRREVSGGEGGWGVRASEQRRAMAESYSELYAKSGLAHRIPTALRADADRRAPRGAYVAAVQSLAKHDVRCTAPRHLGGLPPLTDHLADPLAQTRRRTESLRWHPCGTT